MKSFSSDVNTIYEVINMTNNDHERKEFLKRLKIEVATELGLLQNIKENNDHYRGDVPSKYNGAQGGPIGGNMVKRMVQFSKENLS